MVTKRVFVTLMLIVLVAVMLLAADVPLAGGQDEPGIMVNLTPYENNPVLTTGELGEWDSGGVGTARVVFVDGLFHMFYIGFKTNPVVQGIGYATSEDGLHWTKYEHNPVFLPDVAAARYGVVNHVVLFDGEMWVLYFTPLIELNDLNDLVLRATAPAPTGPWATDAEPIFTAGTEVTDWDWDGVWIETVLKTDEGYRLYYVPDYSSWIGCATSPDGVHWTKYNDTATSAVRFANSDPVFVKDEVFSSWDGIYVGAPAVRADDLGWEMFYGGAQSTGYFAIGYATSVDGITWTRVGDAPLLEDDHGNLFPASVVVVEDTYYLYYHTLPVNEPGATWEIAVATGTVTRE